jgi:hypothetical protein
MKLLKVQFRLWIHNLEFRIRILQKVRILSDPDPVQDPQHWYKIYVLYGNEVKTNNICDLHQLRAYTFYTVW